jgi:hypothetical protein
MISMDEVRRLGAIDGEAAAISIIMAQDGEAGSIEIAATAALLELQERMLWLVQNGASVDAVEAYAQARDAAYVLRASQVTVEISRRVEELQADQARILAGESTRPQ